MTRKISTEGGSYVEGNVSAGRDYVGRDKLEFRISDNVAAALTSVFTSFSNLLDALTAFILCDLEKIWNHP